MKLTKDYGSGDNRLLYYHVDEDHEGGYWVLWLTDAKLYDENQMAQDALRDDVWENLQRELDSWFGDRWSGGQEGTIGIPMSKFSKQDVIAFAEQTMYFTINKNFSALLNYMRSSA